MPFGALASESGLEPFLRALQTLSPDQHTAVWIEEAPLFAKLNAHAPSLKRVQHWDQILTEQGIEAVLICGTSPTMVTAARQFAAAGIRVCILTDTVAGPSRLFQYMPIWQDHPELISPLFLPGMQSISRIALSLFTTSDLHKLWKIEFLRQTPVDSQSGLLTSESIDRWLLQDLDWISTRFGLPLQVTMQTSGAVNQDPQEAIVTLRGEDSPEVRWTLKPGPILKIELRLLGANGEVTACWEDGGPATYLVNGAPTVPDEGETDPVQLDAERQLASLMQNPQSRGTEGLWPRVVQLGEVGAAARRSLQRRRTVDIHYEEVSERSQFKSQMAAVGCGTLLWTLFGAISLLLMGTLLDPRDREFRDSAAAGFVMSAKDFKPQSPEFNERGNERITHISQRWSDSAPTLILEQSEVPELDAQRRDTVVAQLQKLDIADPARQVVVRSVPGRWFEIGMKLGWCAVFLPLGIYLLLQLLIVLSRSA